MGLYLCIFDENEEELDGVEIGSYADFGRFRDSVLELVESGKEGSRCPALMLHSDCDGEWSPDECQLLLAELDVVASAFSKAAPFEWTAGWQKEVARSMGIACRSLADCYFDVDGEPLLDRLRDLARKAIDTGYPIVFQ